MDKQPKKELVEGIKDFLREFEEPYDRAEWKNFRRHRKRKHRTPVPLFIKLAGIAASLVLMVYASVKLLPFLAQNDEETDKIHSELPKPEGITDSLEMGTLGIDSMPSIAVDYGDGLFIEDAEIRGAEVRPIDPVQESSPVHHHAVPPISGIPVSTRVASRDIDLATTPLENVRILSNLPIRRQADQLKSRSLPKLKLPRLNGLFGETAGNYGVNAGVHIDPGFSGKGFYFGGGIFTKLHISSRITAEVGLNYSNLRAGVDRRGDESDTVTTQLVGKRNSIGMVSVPVSVNYAFSESFSAGLGIVPFRVVRDRRTDLLQSYRWVAADILSGDSTGRLITERTTLTRPDTVYKGNTYLGFLRITGQYRPSFLRKYNAAIAPFISIPIGTLKDDEYRWMHGGVSFRIYLR